MQSPYHETLAAFSSDDPLRLNDCVCVEIHAPANLCTESPATVEAASSTSNDDAVEEESHSRIMESTKVYLQ